MATQIMLDLETLGTKPGCVILSIGACKFDLETGTVGDNFHVRVDAESCEAYGLKVDAGTALWWMAPEREAARANLLSHQSVDLASALWGFHTWVGADSMPIWGNGASFDNVVLRAAYEAARMPVPWMYYHDRCYRTMKAHFGHRATLTRIGEHHNALDDARTQAVHLINIVGKVPAMETL